MMDARLRLVYEFLDSELYENALFITERLHALDPDNSTWIHLRALCCLRLGRPGLAAEYSRERGIRGSHLGCSYVFAQACLRQKSYTDGITALRQAQPLWSDKQTTSERFAPDSSAVNRLLGKLYKANGDTKSSVNCYVQSLEANPFLWDAFTDLCDNGVQLRVSNVFKMRDPANKSDPSKLTRSAPSEVSSANSLAKGNLLRPGQSFEAGLREAAQQPFYPSRGDAPIGDENMDLSETRNVRSVSGDMSMGYSGIAAPSLSKKRQRSGLDVPQVEVTGPGRKENDVFSSRYTSSASIAPQRRSARLLGQTAPPTGLTDRSTAESAASRDTFKRLARPKTTVRPTERKVSGLSRAANAVRATGLNGTRDTKAAMPPSPTPPGKSGQPSKLQSSVVAAAAMLDQEKLHLLLCLLMKMGTAYYNLSQFLPQACLDVLATLPPEQQATPWVLSKMGRAQYEAMSYKEAKTTFQALRRVAPSWLEDVEVYSTVLWHLKDDVELAFLGHELTDAHYLSPQTWCAMGNSFSLQRCHQEAIRCFRRAGQLEPRLAYSYSLLGHEHFEAEEYAEATTAFRRALQVDARHYSAWVGLGRVQERLGQADKALKYYQSAEAVNPNNPALLTYIARMHEKLGKHRLALGYLRRGTELGASPNLECLIRLQTGRLYLRLGQPMEAIRELTWVQMEASGEPSVHFLMGQALAMAGPAHRGEALRYYTNALSLDPSNEAIKDALSMLGGDH